MFALYSSCSFKSEVRWQLFARNLIETKHHVLELEEESGYPNYVILMKLSKPDELGCKVEIPSKKHPISYYSDSVSFHLQVHLETRGRNMYTCFVEANIAHLKGTYRSTVVNRDDDIVNELGNYSASKL